MKRKFEIESRVQKTEKWNSTANSGNWFRAGDFLNGEVIGRYKASALMRATSYLGRE